MTTSADVVRFILGEADQATLDAIYSAAKQRTKTLRAVAAAETLTLAPGAPVRTDGLSPRYLNGLTGTFKSRDPRTGRITVTLDKHSTDTLRWVGIRRFNIPREQETYDLGGLPASTVHSV